MVVERFRRGYIKNFTVGFREIFQGQVSYGISVRMAVMTMTLGREPESNNRKQDSHKKNSHTVNKADGDS